jgi:glycosyltransferase involved in cell wall biosynthesis
MSSQRVLLVAQTDGGGGAARAAQRLHRALHGHGVDTAMLVRRMSNGGPGLHGPRGRLEGWLSGLRSPVGRALMRLQRAALSGPRSGNFVPSRWARRIDTLGPDVVHLHWVGDETMSIEDIGRIRQPLVWTLHDTWAFCGTEHVQPDDTRWSAGYSRENRPPGDRGLDLDRRAWIRKRRAWLRPMRIVAPSAWMADCVSRSTLLGHHPVTVIPNVLDTALFCPQDRGSCRAALGLPQNRPLVLFGAIQAGADPNKGFDLLVEALRHLATDMPAAGVECAVFGADAPPAGVELPVTTHWLGRVDEEAALARVYSAADVMVVPSRVENLPQTATEAQACGCPVVAFRTAGLPDAVADRQTGWLARALESRDLAAGIRWVIEDAQRRIRLSQAARERALRLWHADVVLPRLMEQYALSVRDVRPSRSEPAARVMPL